MGKKKENRNFNVYTIADIHFGKKNDKKLNDSLQDFFIDNINTIINDYDHINMVIILGDLFDRVIKMSEYSAKLVIDFINQLSELSQKHRFYLRILKGTKSHDYNQLNNFSKWEIENPLFKIINTVSKENIEYNDIEYSILYLPEEYPANYDKYYKEFINKRANYDFIFGHGMIDFVSYTGNEEEIKLLSRSEAVHKVEMLDKITNIACLFGHVHDFKNHKDEDKIMYVGSFERYSFADVEDKGTIFVSFNPDGDKEVIFFENENASTYYLCDFNDLDNMKDSSIEDQLKLISNLQSEYDYVKIRYFNDSDSKQLMKKLSTDQSNDIVIEVKNNKIMDESIDSRFEFIIQRKYELPKMINKYINIITGKDISEEKIKKFIY